MRARLGLVSFGSVLLARLYLLKLELVLLARASYCVMADAELCHDLISRLVGRCSAKIEIKSLNGYLAGLYCVVRSALVSPARPRLKLFAALFLREGGRKRYVFCARCLR